MITFFKQKKDKENKNPDNKIILICCLFIHAAKMDENYTEKEKIIITKALFDLFKKNESELEIILKQAEQKEKESNQILEFTKEIKNYDKNFRLQIIKVLWKIIYSDGNSDMFESNLMRRLNALLYVSDKESGEIKESILKNLRK